MRSRVPLALLCCGATVVVCLAASGCASDNAIRASGRVLDDRVVVQAPPLVSPLPNVDAGFPLNAPAGPGAATNAGASRSTVPTVAAITGSGSASRVATISVALGDSVGEGDLVATFDEALLEAHVTAARADEVVLRRQVEVLADTLDRVESNRSDLATARRALKETVAQLTATRATLAAKLAELEALLARLQGMSRVGTATVPPQLPPGTPGPDQLKTTIAQLKGALSQIDAGLAKARAGQSKLDAAGSKLADARTQLRDLHDLAVIAADASAIGVRAAEYQRSLASVRAPAAGEVVRIARVGDVLFSGATVAEIREATPPRVLTWLSAEDATRIAIGDRAHVGADWFKSGAALPTGRVTDIGRRADYPPTSFSTKDVHLTRAVPVEVTLDGVPELSARSSAGALPPGTPVDVTILPNTAGRP